MTAKVRRCAVYTRKSSEEGLDQTFNSLDAQREACEAYIRSQAHEGWKLVKTAYDDGGFSGGTLERPALQRLLADLGRGWVDVIVVYKIDRLTRSLADFARIVETLDRQGASFVSITQQFNTTTSMGRLTLNVLLSFAQFEREVTGERIRDKIAASKRKGMWMGGNLPLGYDVKDRQLVANDAEAETVRYLFQRYVELGTVAALQTDLKRRGIVSKVWTSSNGKKRGGLGYSRGALYYLLRNAIYVGRIAHRGASYAGQHSGIVPQDLWDRAQALLTENRQGARAARSSDPCMLSGLLFDDRGNVMSPSHARKANGRRYRYYVSQAVLQGRQEGAGSIRRVSAEAIETLIERTLCKSLPKAKQAEWVRYSTEQKRERIKRLVERITIRADNIEIGLTEAGRDLFVDAAPSEAVHIATVMKAGVGGRQIVRRDGASARVDRSLVKAIAWARDLRQRLERDGKSLDELAREDGCSRPYVSSMIRLAYLAPSITQSILQGTQPAQLTLADLMQRDIPVDWSEQRIAFGFL
ncbi:MAG: site-specific recombinase [Rhodospirillaceae bacterium]|nr:site-specific recombinase [Rhodospirillaceae bacterium]